MDRLRQLLPYWRAERRALAAVLLATVAAAGLAALQPWPLKLVVDHLLGGHPLPGPVETVRQALLPGASPGLVLLCLAAAGVFLFALAAATDALLTWLWTAAGGRMVNALAADLFGRLQRRSILFHRRAEVGDLMSRITGDAWCVYRLADTLVAAPFHALLSFAFMAGLMWHIDPSLTGVALLTAPAVVWSSTWVARPIRDVARRRREMEGALYAHVQQTLTGIPVVQAFAREDHHLRRFQAVADSAVGAQRRLALLAGFNGLFSGLFAKVGTAVVLWWGARLVLSDTLSVGSLLLFLAYLGALQAQVRVFAGLNNERQRSRASLDRVFACLDVPPEVRDPPAARPLGAVRGDVAFEGVTFGYDRDRPVLQAVSLAVRAGQTVAVVGPTGAGKSTLVRLLPRFFDPWDGCVLLDGRDLRELPLADLRRQVAFLPQEAILFPRTVAENIAFGVPGASREDVVAAARAARADGFVERLPEGYDTVLAERGTSLSGGERQRIALARAILRRAPLLVLDEPTSALDPGTERDVLHALDALRRGATTLLVAHRLSTVRAADAIAVLDEGRLTEFGSHDELVRAGGRYARYVALQRLPGEEP